MATRQTQLIYYEFSLEDSEKQPGSNEAIFLNFIGLATQPVAGLRSRLDSINGHTFGSLLEPSFIGSLLDETVLKTEPSLPSLIPSTLNRNSFP